MTQRAATAKAANSKVTAESEVELEPAAPTEVELRTAAELVIERERKRKRRSKKKARKLQREREKAQLAAIERMQNSIEVMKWCLVGISAVMFLGIVMAIWTLSSVHGEIVKVQAEVEKVRPQIDRVVDEATEIVDGVARVREALQNPMESIGRQFGKDLDAKLESLIGGKQSE